jgi:hypothetical protein
VRSAAPIDGQLSFGVLLEEPPQADPAETPGADEAPPSPDVVDETTATVAEPTPPPAPVADPGHADESAPAVEPADPQDWHAILDFEREWAGAPTAKQRAVRDRFGIGSARYHQLLDRALERPEALVYDPGLVGRLRRVREARRRKRFAERLEIDPFVDPTGEPTGQGGGGG